MTDDSNIPSDVLAAIDADVERYKESRLTAARKKYRIRLGRFPMTNDVREAARSQSFQYHIAKRRLAGESLTSIAEGYRYKTAYPVARWIDSFISASKTDEERDRGLATLLATAVARWESKGIIYLTTETRLPGIFQRGFTRG